MTIGKSFTLSPKQPTLDKAEADLQQLSAGGSP